MNPPLPANPEPSDDAFLAELFGSSAPTLLQPNPTDGLDSQLQMVAKMLAAVPSLPAEPSLLWQPGDGTTRTVAIGNALTVGRTSESRIAIRDDKHVSKKHLEISLQDGAFFLRDCDSTNGTRLNNRPLAKDETRHLLDGDLISAGTHRFVFLAGMNALPAAEAGGDQPSGSGG